MVSCCAFIILRLPVQAQLGHFSGCWWQRAIRGDVLVPHCRASSAARVGGRRNGALLQLWTELNRDARPSAARVHRRPSAARVHRRPRGL